MWNVRWPAWVVTVAHATRGRGLACVFLASLGLASYGQQENALILSGGAESNTSARDKSSTPIKIRVDSNLVVVPVTVTDGKGRIVNGLQKEHFALYEDKVEQPISHFTSEDAAVSIGLVFDASGSMAPRLHKAREAVATLLNNTNREDELFLVQFNNTAQLLVDFTTQTEEIRRHVESMQAGGGTALLDGVNLALQQMTNAHHIRKAIIIVSDGEDNASHYFVREIQAAVRRADVLIYAIGLGDSSVHSQDFRTQRPTGAALLNEIATETGGCLFQVGKLAQLPSIASKISTWLRSQYVLAYVPSNDGKAGYRHIQVKITKPKGFPSLHAFWRLGYYPPAQ